MSRFGAHKASDRSVSGGPRVQVRNELGTLRVSSRNPRSAAISSTLFEPSANRRGAVWIRNLLANLTGVQSNSGANVQKSYEHLR
jgi:hypothetical protein